MLEHAADSNDATAFNTWLSILIRFTGHSGLLE
jgi:hypothetical protein